MRNLKQGGFKTQRKEPYATQEEFKRHVIHYKDVPPIDETPGATSHLVISEKTMLMFGTMAPNSVHALHRHESEQITIVVDGAMDFMLEGKLYHVEKGGLMIFPPNIEHAAYVSDKGVCTISVFTPPRRDYLAKLEATRKGLEK